MDGKPRDMNYKFAIKVLNSAKVTTPSMHGNPKYYGYQNQTFYDIARRMAIQALKKKYENHGKWIKNTTNSTCSSCGGNVISWSGEHDGYEREMSISLMKFCPHCGAKMDIE